jgi:hypothetical protein
VTVRDENNLPIPAKVQLVGSDPTPDPAATRSSSGSSQHRWASSARSSRTASCTASRT